MGGGGSREDAAGIMPSACVAALLGQGPIVQA